MSRPALNQPCSPPSTKLPSYHMEHQPAVPPIILHRALHIEHTPTNPPTHRTHEHPSKPKATRYKPEPRPPVLFSAPARSSSPTLPFGAPPLLLPPSVISWSILRCGSSSITTRPDASMSLRSAACVVFQEKGTSVHTSDVIGRPLTRGGAGSKVWGSRF